MIIVIEGPDNTGKTTLGLAIAKQLRAVFVKAERPSSGVRLQNFHNILEYAKTYSGTVVADRHVAISEPIYGQIIRGGHQLDPSEMSACLNRIDVIVYCRPPRDRILETIDERPQMEGVVTKLNEIIHAYDYALDPRTWCYGDPKLIHYDFTNPAHSPENVVKAVLTTETPSDH